MDASELAKAVRGGDAKFRVDDLALDTGTRLLTGRGYLRIQPISLTVRMTLDAETDPLSPEGGPGVATKSDFWKLTGTLDLELRFRCNFGPGPNFHNRNGVWTLEETVNPIELELKSWGRLSIEERRERWDEIQLITTIDPDSEETKADRTAAFEAEEARRLANGSFEFHADFVDHKLRFKNETTHVERRNPFFGDEGSSSKRNTLIGETSTYKFAFVQEDDNDDLRLVMRSKENQPPLGEAEHLRKYEALVQALSFVHGINAWPYRLQYWRGDDKWTDKFSAPRPAPRTAHSPFSGLRHEVNMSAFLPKVAEFLEPSTPFNDELMTMMYLFRQAGAKGVHRKVGSLSLCALLESLTRLLFTHYSLKEPSPTGAFGDFDSRKAALLIYLRGLSSPTDSVRRLHDIVSSAQSTKKLKVEDKFQMVCLHLGLPWDGHMKLVQAAWESLRNPLAHGDFREGESITEQVFKDDTVAESRIAGGFNTILLKLFGYSGPYNSSAFESGYRRM